MARSPEIEPPLVKKEEEFQVQGLEEAGIRAVEREFKTPLKNDKGQVIVSAPDETAVSITIPERQEALVSAAKGSVEESSTWWAAAWLRAIKKAIRAGWNLVFKG